MTTQIPKHGPILGWREWISLPSLHIPRIKAKIDTGARTSALHAVHIEEFRENGVALVRFRVHPEQRNDHATIVCTAPLVDRRNVKSSTGHATTRPVVAAEVLWQGFRWEIELTLVGRSDMGFRMLLGREAIRGRFLVDPAASFIGGSRARPKKKTKPPSRRSE